MTRSTTEDVTKDSEKRDRSNSVVSLKVPLHFAVHKPGCHFESCCGICNLFPGVLLIGFGQVLAGAVLLTLILTSGRQYDEWHQTYSTESSFAQTVSARQGTAATALSPEELHTSSKLVGPPTLNRMSTATGIVLSAVTGAGVMLIVVALTENCRAMLIYLLVALMVWVSITMLAITKISRACVRFKDVAKIKDEQHRLANLACVTGLYTFMGAVVYFFSLVVVFSFYHFRYVRRAILMHEAECA